MISFLLDIALKLVSLIPLRALHAIGSVLGVIAYKTGHDYRLKMDSNLRQAGIFSQELLNAAKRHAGMQALETGWVWKRTNAQVMKHMMSDGRAEKTLNDALAEGRTIVVMTPHVGCYETAPIWLYEQCLKAHGKKMTVLYREPRQVYIRDLVARGRVRDGMDPAPADLSGVRKIVKAMRGGGVLGCLPDQVPGRGEGVWAPFFGRPAFTMTFPMKMAKQFDSIRLMLWTERVPGKGWKIYLERWDDPLSGDPLADATAMNAQIEKTILQYPEQYIWNYNRYRAPDNAEAPKPDAAAK